MTNLTSRSISDIDFEIDMATKRRIEYSRKLMSVLHMKDVWWDRILEMWIANEPLNKTYCCLYCEVRKNPEACREMYLAIRVFDEASARANGLQGMVHTQRQLLSKLYSERAAMVAGYQ